jgi:gas vesicle protein
MQELAQEKMRYKIGIMALQSKRRKGRPRMKRLDDVESDLKKMVKGWKEKIRDREQWRVVVEEAKDHPGL